MRATRTHYSHRGMRTHKVSPLWRFTIHILVPFLIVALGLGAVKGFSVANFIGKLDLSLLISALGASFIRLIIAYIISMILAVMFALWATSSRRAEAILLPLFDVLESVPVLVFFPIIIVFFVRFGFFDAAAIVILSLNMVWNIVFNIVGGIRVIPQDVKVVPRIFGLSYWQRLVRVTLPAIIPSLITGSLLAWAEGWNMLIVAEVLRNYAPAARGSGDLFGIGSVLVNATSSGDSGAFIGAVLIVVSAVILLNILVWQPLLKFSERFAFDA